LLQCGWNFHLKLGGMKAHFRSEESAVLSKDQSKVVIEED
jgi:hypothetical protein